MAAKMNDSNRVRKGIAGFPVMLSKVLNSKACVSVEIALRLSVWLSTSPDVWLGMQSQWDLCQAEQQPRPTIKPLARHTA